MEAKIKEITTIGSVVLEFTDIVLKFDHSILNETFLNLYIEPALNRQNDATYENS